MKELKNYKNNNWQKKNLREFFHDKQHCTLLNKFTNPIVTFAPPYPVDSLPRIPPKSTHLTPIMAKFCTFVSTSIMTQFLTFYTHKALTCM